MLQQLARTEIESPNEREVYKNLQHYGFPDVEISNYGRCNSVLTNRRIFPDEKCRVSVKNEKGELVTPRLWMLVALAFVPNPSNWSFLSPINGDVRDLRARNWQWVRVPSLPDLPAGVRFEKKKMAYCAQIQVRGNLFTRYFRVNDSIGREARDNAIACLNGN
jgi:hypothetical protein